MKSHGYTHPSSYPDGRYMPVAVRKHRDARAKKKAKAARTRSALEKGSTALGSSLSTHRRRHLVYGAAVKSSLKSAKRALKRGNCGAANSALMTASMSAGLSFGHDVSRGQKRKKAFFTTAVGKSIAAVKKSFNKHCKISKKKG